MRRSSGARTFPTGDASVDLVVGNLGLEHVEHLAPIFRSAARVLREGGTLYLCELHPYRQLRGRQAHFVDAETGDTVHVPACLHSISAYVNGGIAAGLELVELGEWHDEHADAASVPRLVSVRFCKQGTPPVGEGRCGGRVAGAVASGPCGPSASRCPRANFVDSRTDPASHPPLVACKSTAARPMTP
jgi:SAM-dependent methyltransferase